MLSRLQGKQNLWWFTEGHCTKCVSSSRSWQIVHFSVGFGGVGLPPLAAPVEVPVAAAGPLPPLVPFAPGVLLLLPGLTPSAAAEGDWLTDPLLGPLGPPDPPFACPGAEPPGFGGGPPAPGSPMGLVPFVLLAAFAACALASVDVTVVLETCREPDDRRPLEDPGKI